MDKISIDVSTPASMMTHELFGGRYYMHFDLGYQPKDDELVIVAKFDPSLKPKDEALFRMLYGPWIKKDAPKNHINISEFSSKRNELGSHQSKTETTLSR